MYDPNDTRELAPTPAPGNQVQTMQQAMQHAPVVFTPPPVAIAPEQSRAMAEVQAAIYVAQRAPRNVVAAIDAIMQDCALPALAERALYHYARGGTDITGPSIRLAECLAQRWGNLQFGIKELAQHATHSEMQAYAWDMETNLKREITFQVPHVRDTKGGRKAVSDSRDVYEVVANMGARRVRACLLAVIPGYIVDMAVEQIEATLKTRVVINEELLTKTVAAFAAHGVSRAMLEARIQRRLEAITPALVVQLRKVYNSLQDGMSSPEDWFDMSLAGAKEAQEGPDPGSQKPPAKRRGVRGLKERLAAQAQPTPTPAPPTAVAMPAAGELFEG